LASHIGGCEGELEDANNDLPLSRAGHPNLRRPYFEKNHGDLASLEEGTRNNDGSNDLGS